MVEEEVVVVIDELLDVVEDEVDDELVVKEVVNEVELDEETLVGGETLCDEDEELTVEEIVELVCESVTATPPMTIMTITITTTAMMPTREIAFLKF